MIGAVWGDKHIKCTVLCKNLASDPCVGGWEYSMVLEYEVQYIQW